MRLVSWGGMLESMAPMTQLTGSFTISAQPGSCKAHVGTIVLCCQDKGVHGRSSRGCQAASMEIVDLHTVTLRRLGIQDAP